MSILNKSMHMRITINGKTSETKGSQQISNHIREFLLKLSDMRSHGVSTIVLELKSSGFTAEAPKDDDGMAALYALAEQGGETETIPPMTSDPIFMEYLSMLSAGNRERATPDRLHFLRDYIERTYPEYYRNQGHHF